MNPIDCLKEQPFQGLEFILQQQEQLKIVIDSLHKQYEQIMSICKTEQTVDCSVEKDTVILQKRAIPKEIQYQPLQIQVMKMNRKKRKNPRGNYLEGRWTVREHRIYLQCLQKFSKIINKSDSKKKYQIFKQMSQLIRTRTSAQCRAHHKRFDFTNYLAQTKQNSLH